ncbi:signal transduction protein [Haloprofundus marisrubri]|uniref:Signal transduction protein n=1 Tax=Haloprofundus marisrubri TaxID=1514971 RepID=A0A0W1R5G4_9EURY|nr:CBS domain-containing protein [Haloprofundus marisrubri]KTG08487.1 signal transduction protein [Haloprofundus marisrubri]
MPVGDLANEDVVTVDPDTNIREIAQTFSSEGVGSVVVVESDEPRGIVTDREIALAIGEHDDISEMTAQDIMSENPETIHHDEDGFAVAKKLGEAKVRRLPVVDDDGTLVGIVTLDDVVATVGEEMTSIADVIESQSPGYSA